MTRPRLAAVLSALASVLVACGADEHRPVAGGADAASERGGHPSLATGDFTPERAAGSAHARRAIESGVPMLQTFGLLAGDAFDRETGLPVVSAGCVVSSAAEAEVATYNREIRRAFAAGELARHGVLDRPSLARAFERDDAVLLSTDEAVHSPDGRYGLRLERGTWGRPEDLHLTNRGEPPSPAVRLPWDAGRPDRALFDDAGSRWVVRTESHFVVVDARHGTVRQSMSRHPRE